MKRLCLLVFAMILSSVGILVAQQQKADKDVNAVKVEKESVKITIYDNTVKVENAPEGSFLEVYSVVGIKVKEIEMKQSSGQYYINLAKGYYIIRIADTVRKIAVR